MKATLFALALVFNSAVAFAGPVEAVEATVKQLLSTLKQPDEATKVKGLCSLVDAKVDTKTIGTDLLGRQFAGLERDRQGIQTFMSLVPSVVVNEFYATLKKVRSDEYSVDDNAIPKGSGRVGVRANVGGTVLVITVSSVTPHKVLDVEWNNISLVGTKRSQYQQDLQRYWNEDTNASLPVTKLAEQLMNSRMIRCN